jgi:hypothetical protein
VQWKNNGKQFSIRKTDLFVKLFIGGTSVGILVLSWLNLRKYPNLVFYDPSYAYLYNGVVITQGGIPGHTDHPGTSLQWISGFASQIFHVFRNNGTSLAQDVVANSEIYIQVSGLLLAAIFCLSIGVFGFRILKQLGAIESIIAVIVFWAGFELWYPQIHILSPESLVISTSILVVALLLPKLFQPHDQTKRSTLIVIGVLLSIGITSKVIAVPIVLMIPFLFKPRQVAMVTIALISTTTVILIPVYSRAGLMLGYFFGIATKPSRWGQETAEQLSVWRNIQNSLTNFAEATPQLAGYLVGAMVLTLGLIGLRKKNRMISPEPKSWKPFVGLQLSIIATFAMGFKQAVDRDFVLLVVLIPVFILLMFQKYRPLIFHGLKRKSFRLTKRAVIIVFIGSSIITLRTVRETSLNLGALEGSYKEVISKVAKLEDSNWLVSTYLIPSLGNASLFGSYWANNAFSEELANAFPRYMDLNILDKSIRGWNREASLAILDCLEINERIRSSEMFILIPDYLDDYWPDRSGSLRLSGQTLKIESETLIGNGFTLIAVTNCKSD